MFNVQFDNPRAIDAADYLFRGRKAKAQAKIKKAEKAASKGNIKKAERKLEKGIKALGKLNPDKNAGLVTKAEQAAKVIKDVRDRQSATGQNISDISKASTVSQPEPSGPLAQPLDPVSTQSGASGPGWQGSMPTPSGGGGGGDMGGSDILSSPASNDPGEAIQNEWNAASLQDQTEQDAQDLSPDAAVTAAGSKGLLVAVGIVAAIVIIFVIIKKSK